MSIVFDNDGLVVTEANGNFYVKYDAGAHKVIMRQDEISAADAQRVMSSPSEATKVLFELQKRLIQAGIDPYVSNFLG